MSALAGETIEAFALRIGLQVGVHRRLVERVVREEIVSGRIVVATGRARWAAVDNGANRSKVVRDLIAAEQQRRAPEPIEAPPRPAAGASW